MKKVSFLFVAVAAMTFAACGGNSANTEAPAEDSTLVEEVVEEVVEVVEDSLAADTTAVEEVAAPVAE
ncbi:MAG: hypothetical protein HUK01_07805 [Bacteroidaceae bacterium]|nr:hypothetical protein [Bacteroidaceae bacterium]